MIETSRLFIREFTEPDRQTVVNLLQDPVFMENSGAGEFDSKGAHDRFDQLLSYTASGLGKRAIILKETGEIIGYCGIEPFQLNGLAENELGYRLVAKHRGMGLATEASIAVSNHYQGRLFAYVDRKNSKSIRVLTKIGFLRQGTCNIHGKEYELYQKNT